MATIKGYSIRSGPKLFGTLEKVTDWQPEAPEPIRRGSYLSAAEELAENAPEINPILLGAAMVYLFHAITQNGTAATGRANRSAMAKCLKVRKQTACKLWKFCLNADILQVFDKSYLPGKYTKSYRLGPAHPDYLGRQPNGWEVVG